MTSENARAKPIHQRRVVGRVKVMALILSVTEPKVCPSPRRGEGSAGGECAGVGCGLSMSAASLQRNQVQIGIAKRCQVSGARSGVQVSQETIAIWLILELGNPALALAFLSRPIQVAKDDGSCWAGGLAS